MILKVGEKRIKRFTITEENGGSVTVSTAFYTIYNKSGDVVKASSNATIENNTSPLVTIVATFDTTTTGMIVGEEYTILFCITIGSEVYEPSDKITITDLI